MEKIDAVVIGAGVVGIAVARALQLALKPSGRQVYLLEKEEHFGSGVSSRNSGVIHAGFYYPEKSLKASLCVRGKEMLYDYAAERGIAHKRLGKLVVATEADQIPKLEALKAQGAKNGVTDLVLMDPADIKAQEPNVSAVKGLWSPSTGIVEIHDFMVNLLGDFENAGGIYVHDTAVTGGVIGCDGHIIETAGMALKADIVINAAGLGAQAVAQSMTGFNSSLIPQQYLARGNYFWMEGKAPFNSLIYPLPTKGGLGAHSHTDFNGRTRFGPDVEWIDREDYTVNKDHKANFIEQIKRYYPALDPADLHPDFSGIRPKIVGPDQGVTDFMIQTHKDHGEKGLVNLFGIESPGLTSALAIGEVIADQHCGEALKG